MAAAVAVGQELPFREVWMADFEFHAPDGERPRPICLVAKELRSGKEIRMWEDELRAATAAPFAVGRDALFVAFYASAEASCFLSLGWRMPDYVLDLFTEFRCATNGLPLPCGAGLLGALAYYGLDAMAAAEKTEMRDLAIRGGPFSDEERTGLLDYCASDVCALERLLPAMLPRLDLPRAILRGRYMKAAATMEHNGVPIDVATLTELRERWDEIKGELIAAVDADYHVFDGQTFKLEKWAEYLAAHDIAWPRLPSGQLAMDDDTFRDAARSNPAVAPIRELRHALSQMRLAELAVGSDGRNRTMLSAFRARTSRNQPSNTKFIFGPSTWLRSLIAPTERHGVAYVDWSQQEFGIAAALSGDVAMMRAYSTGDPYLEFAKQAGAIPPDGTKATHGPVREKFKTCALATAYGMGPELFAQRINVSVAEARILLEAHRSTYPDFWRWSDAAVDHAMLHGWIHTVFGWRIHVGTDVNPRSLRNFPAQANGAEMLRLACCLATERGVTVCAPVHDALLIEAPLDQLEQAIATAQASMAEASRVVLGGFELRTDVKVIRYPDRYSDPRGERMWSTVQGILRPVRQCTGDPCANARVATLSAPCAGAPVPVRQCTPGTSPICLLRDL